VLLDHPATAPTVTDSVSALLDDLPSETCVLLRLTSCVLEPLDSAKDDLSISSLWSANVWRWGAVSGASSTQASGLRRVAVVWSHLAFPFGANHAIAETRGLQPGSWGP
jgi:hypothetical protein